jgi:hypothetical protein
MHQINLANISTNVFKTRASYLLQSDGKPIIYIFHIMQYKGNILQSLERQSCTY